jgi:hypothetical protein
VLLRWDVIRIHVERPLEHGDRALCPIGMPPEPPVHVGLSLEVPGLHAVEERLSECRPFSEPIGVGLRIRVSSTAAHVQVEPIGCWEAIPMAVRQCERGTAACPSLTMNVIQSIRTSN